MPFVATLVAPAHTANLSDALVRRAAQAIPGVLSTTMIEPGIAADIVYQGGPEARGALEALLARESIDAIVQDAATRGKKLILADMDSTLIGQECIDELAAEAGVGAHVAGITERAMRGEIPFEGALKERVALLKGVPESTIDRLLETRITLNPGARALFRTMRAHGAHTAIVSGGFTPFTGAIARRIGAHEHRANRLGIEGAMLTGDVIEPILGREAKLQALEELIQRFSIPRSATLAVGDGANDLAMLGAAGLGVAYRAKPKVAAAAAARIEFADLTALLYAQGIARKDFVLD